MMKLCWSHEDRDRPDFDALMEAVETVIYQIAAWQDNTLAPTNLPTEIHHKMNMHSQISNDYEMEAVFP